MFALISKRYSIFTFLFGNACQISHLAESCSCHQKYVVSYTRSVVIHILKCGTRGLREGGSPFSHVDKNGYYFTDVRNNKNRKRIPKSIVFLTSDYAINRITAVLCSTELFLKYMPRAVMFCIVSVDLGSVAFLHWIQMAAALLSVSLCLTKGCFPSLFSSRTPASLARSSCRGIRMKLWEYLFYSLSITV